MIDYKTFIIAGLVIAIIIGVTAVFFASGDPDGLESAALFVQDEKTLTGLSPEDGNPEAVGTGTFEYEAPLPDYSMGEEGGKTGEIIALIAGILLMFLLGYGISRGITSIKS